MSFWRFGFSQSSIDTLLASSSPPADGDAAAPSLTLEQLLEEDDLLQELKSQHAKLITFLSRPAVVRRMLQYVDGTAFDQQDDVQDEDEGERERKRRKFPYLCSEILCADVWPILEVIFRDTATYLAPFWDAVLDREAETTASSNIQLAFWAKVNGAWLGNRTKEMVAFVNSLPSIIERLVAHIAAPSIADLLFRLVQCEEAPSGRGIIDWLAEEHLVSRLVVLLSPRHPPDTHTTVAEFLKATIAFCSNANAVAATAELQPSNANHASSPAAIPAWPGSDEAPVHHADDQTPPPGPRWASNRLLRDLAAADTVSILVDYILDPPRPDAIAPISRSDVRGVTPTDSTEEASTPRTLIKDLPSRIPSPPRPRAPAEATIDPASISSSLIQSASVLIDLIRKNNSDFTEQQILNVLRKQAREDEIAVSTNQTARPRAGPLGPSVVQLDGLLNVVSARMADFQRILLEPSHSVAPIETSLGRIEPLTIERFRICELYAELLHCSNMALLNRPPGVPPNYDEDGHIVGGTAAIDALAFALAPGELGLPETASPGSLAVVQPPLASAFTSSYNSPNSTLSADDQLQSIDHLALTDSPRRTRSNESLAPGTPSIGASVTSSPSIDSETGYLTRDEKRALDALLEAGEADGSQAAYSPPMRPPAKPRPGAVASGHRLKAGLLEYHVVGTLLDLFFAFPWNNFLHTVVYDVMQQILNGRMERHLNHRLCRSLFTDAHLPRRILDGHARNAAERGRRLGYMGHLTLIADEVVKFTMHHEDEARGPLAACFPQPEWDRYVSTSLRELRDRDLQPLGGGVAQPIMEAHQASLAFSDEDDEFPMGGAGGKIPKDLYDGVPAADEVDVPAKLGESGEAAGGVSTGKGTETPASDQFARYLVSQISGDLPDKFSGASSDEDDADEVVGWVGESAFDPKDVEFELGEAERDAPPSFGFDDRWDSLDRKVLGLASHSDEDDDGFGDFVNTDLAMPKVHNPFATDTFAPMASTSAAGMGAADKNLTPADWTADWQTQIDRDPFGDDAAGSDDCFGDFDSTWQTQKGRSSSLTDVPLSPDASGDFDLQEYSRRHMP